MKQGMVAMIAFALGVVHCILWLDGQYLAAWCVDLVVRLMCTRDD